MKTIQNQLEAFWGATIKEISIDVINRSIHFKILTLVKNNEEIDNIVQLKFNKIYSFFWLNNSGQPNYEGSYDMNYVELSSLILNNINLNSHKIKWLKYYNTEFNISIEILDSVLLINAKILEIDNESYIIM